MKLKYIVGIIIAVIALSVGAYSFLNNKIDYTDFNDAKYNVRKVQVCGQQIKSEGENYDIQNNTFTFTMVDHKGIKSKIVFQGPKPINFDIAEAFVVEGSFKGDVFYADQILTKCPSKYEGRKPIY